MIACLTAFFLLNALKIDFQLKIDLSSAMPMTDPFFVASIVISIMIRYSIFNRLSSNVRKQALTPLMLLYTSCLLPIATI